MARSPLISCLAVLAALAFGLRCAFVPSPQTAQAPEQSPTQLLQGAALASGAFLASAAPAMA
eukprot:CAMPEP_0175367536 /NCGR_PEP_ID=MMETSP0095-20121207/19714_1 /TAXON_ID=311494 /ORGANISM="Alexandrium monilatum, Strain CCMP3105" /LENGTH=61 /DNA_ID=CAMNT_0016665599 /DNA_START=65 /DNA_END=247 /DNA_ORIENTATION=-